MGARRCQTEVRQSKGPAGAGVCRAHKHPGRKDAVKEGLHQRGAEEGRAPLALEADAQRLLQCRPHGVQRGCVARGFHARQAVAGVGCQQPGQVAGFGQRGPVGQGAAQVLGQRRTDAVGEGAGVLQLGLEVGGGVCQPEGLQLDGLPLRVLPQQHKVAGVGDQHETVALPVAADLRAVGGEPGVVAGGLDLHHAGLGCLSLLGLALRHLPGGVESKVGMSRALLGQLADAIHLGPQ